MNSCLSQGHEHEDKRKANTSSFQLPSGAIIQQHGSKKYFQNMELGILNAFWGRKLINLN